MMDKKIDLKNRVVEIFNVDTGLHEDEIISYLKRSMKVIFHQARFSNRKYVFTGNPNSHINNTITVTGFRKKKSGENISVDIG